MSSQKNQNNRIKRILYPLLAIGFWIGVWELASRSIDNEILLASPLEVFLTVIELGQTTEFWQAIAFSSLHILLGFVMALVLGTVLAVLSHGLGVVRGLVSPLMKVVKATPVASFIILVLFWFNSENLSAYISFLMVLPVVYLNILQGLKSADEKLLQMARVFRLSYLKKIRAIYLPAVVPYLITAVSIGLGFGFKSGIAAEVIGTPARSIGRSLYEAKLYLMIKEMLAWTLIIILISVLFEKAVLWLIRLLQHKDNSEPANEDKV